MSQVEYQHHSAHGQAQLWGLLSSFLELDWMPGLLRVVEDKHEGYTARLLYMGDQEPIVEYLLERDEPGCRFRYGVLKNPFVPVDDYVAEVSIKPEGEGSLVTFNSQFTLGDADEAEVRMMLTGAYKMMAEAADEHLASQLKS